MTRETKIGLLVGLAFIIVIGILLSDHFHNMEPPPANISGVGNSARQAVNSPGTGDPLIVHYTPHDAPPHDQVATHDELYPPHNPVTPLPRRDSPATGNDLARTQTPPVVPSGVDPRLQAIARQHGEDIVPVDPAPAPAPGPTAVASMKSYKAQSGDTVSRMASRFLGGNTRVNRQAIIDANASLQDDPDTIIVGKTYMIPTSAGTTTAAAVPAAPAAPVTPSPAPGDHFYTVEAGDSLWAIANDQLGDPGAVDAIKELNKNILRGENHDVVRPGMKLRLPAKAVVASN